MGLASASTTYGLDRSLGLGTISIRPNARRRGCDSYDIDVSVRRSLAKTRGSPRPHRPEHVASSHRWAFLIVLLAVEVIGVTVIFDSREVQDELEPLLDISRVTFQVLMVAAGIWLVFRDGGERQPPARRAKHRNSLAFRPGASGHCARFHRLHGRPVPGWTKLPRPHRLGCRVDSDGAGDCRDLARDRVFTVALGSLGQTALASRALLSCHRSGRGCSRTAQHLWQPLAWGTLRVVHRSLQLVSPEVVYEPASYRVGTPTFQVEIAPLVRAMKAWG